ncbi:hypothetical protein A2716_03125 [candidate division WWE3 bacterium RIFCSPHIGHO2_01_FULL_40_23]|uniref:Glycosyltransferase RgtA/B/C/D-like domain-containing protein n=1 Tax=candidate division WWE3 bacterium RIFCSPLOWO2_01_FULL_41_18 TaxID=1802625 RepID=A0A1F4VCG5_UNCKA|nr:MAG: hypothetical protein A2716_03125 [candidate division WWE3 bacterium RIFCSPHIGHO2_01_FULL_40_23]OGC54819.1 MAG: hypothetical protein A3A78_05080 [candidate division WWE3 bacterium RIFCSPLOWO2_01_FULL_41_18]
MYKKLLVAATAFYFFLTSLVTVNNYHLLRTNADDIGSIIYKIECSLELDLACLFIGHATPVVIPISILFLIFRTPLAFPVLQALLVSCVALVIFKYASYELKSESEAFLASILFLVNPFVQSASVYEFKTPVASMFFLALGLYFMYRGRDRPYFFISLFLLTFQEDVALTTAFMGFSGFIYHYRNTKAKPVYLISGLLALVYFLLSLILIKNAGLEKGFIAPVFYDRYSAIRHPLSAVSPLGVGYTLLLFWPLLFIPFLSPVLLIGAIPRFLLNILSRNLMTVNLLLYYHSATILPFCFSAFIKSLHRFKHRTAVLVICMVINLVLSVWYGPFFLHYFKNADGNQSAKTFWQLKGTIEQGSTISAQNNLVAYFYLGNKARKFPCNKESADYVVLLPRDIYPPGVRTLAMYNQISMSLDQYKSYIEDVFTDENYGVWYYKNGILLFKRGFSRDKNETAYKIFVKDYEHLIRLTRMKMGGGMFSTVEERVGRANVWEGMCNRALM